MTSQEQRSPVRIRPCAILVPSSRLLRLGSLDLHADNSTVFFSPLPPSASTPQFPSRGTKERQTMVQKELAPLIDKQKGKYPTTLPCLLLTPLFFLLSLLLLFFIFLFSALRQCWRRRPYTAVVYQPTHLLEPRRVLRGARVIFFSSGSHLQLCVNWLLRRRALCVFQWTAESSRRRGWRPRCVLHPGGP